MARRPEASTWYSSTQNECGYGRNCLDQIYKDGLIENIRIVHEHDNTFSLQNEWLNFACSLMSSGFKTKFMPTN